MHSLTQYCVAQGLANSECSVLGKDRVATVCPGATEHRRALWNAVMVTPGDRGPFCPTSIRCSVRGGSCHSRLPCGRTANMSPPENRAAATTDNLPACCDWLTEEGRKGGPLEVPVCWADVVEGPPSQSGQAAQSKDTQAALILSLCI